MKTTVFFSLENCADKGDALLELVSALKRGGAADSVYDRDPALFSSIPNYPLCYWLPASLLAAYSRYSSVKTEFTVRSGSVTFDDFRFLRLSWEVPPLVQRDGDRLLWHSISKGGEFSQFIADVHLLVDWRDGGDYVGRCVYLHRPREGYGWGTRGRNKEFFGKPSVTWSRRSQKGFSARVLPAGNVFSDKSPVVQHSDRSMLWYFVGVANTAVFRSLLRAQVAFGSYEVGAIERSPLPLADREPIVFQAKRLHGLKQAFYVQDERSRLFCSPPQLCPFAHCLSAVFAEADRRNQQLERAAEEALAELDSAVAAVYNVEQPILDKEPSRSDGYPEGTDGLDETDAAEAEFQDGELPGHATKLLSYIVGGVFGRWDIRFAKGEKPVPELPDPFAPLPVCPPGMLQSDQGLPLAEDDARRLQAVGQWSYPIEIPWDGILVDDLGPEGTQSHRDDIVRRVQAALTAVWKDRSEVIEQEACEILGVKELREYFRKPSLFFADHLKRYSKSRRQAPIYWPLSTASGSYTLWIYYHRLNDQTLYTALNEHVKPKIDDVENELRRIESDLPNATGHEASRLRDAFEETKEFLEELRELRDELLRVAGLPYKPDLNDGVLITASPLWKLFRLPKWRKDLEDCWKKLAAGDYDWAHLAYSIWPDRVREVCKRDRSIAIAHDLEELCEVHARPSKKTRSGKQKGVVEQSVLKDEE